MDGYKAVILSEPPIRSAHIGTQAYRGVLLCEQPRAAAPAAATSDPFVVGRSERLTNDLGLHRARDAEGEAAANRPSRRKEETALTKHRKLIHELERARQEERATLAQAQNEAETRAKQFREEQHKFRNEILNRGSGSGSDQDTAPRHPTPPKAVPVAAAVQARPRRLSSSSSSARSNSGRRKPTNKPKPKWAMTEDEALDAELEETAQLALFAENLDYDEYLKDMDIQAALEAIKEKVETLSEGCDNDKEDAASDATEHVPRGNTTSLPAIPRQRQPVTSGSLLPPPTPALSTVSHDYAWTFSSRSRKAITEEALRLAEGILAGNEALRAVHSKQSLARVLEALAHRTMAEEREAAKAAKAGK
eukprot:TRINITY_DN870_c0_g1_i1.p1 TRINITY_DN870_c0_g1~~TRINITY_DN870_c0_g1_i1.p1  ORF type:complete len:364 (+),score=65.95 TRINITY_DN870_c0_g1_i1:72-1163(+)